jgi:nucleoside 2-deoxyribosyltransferase
VKVYFAGPLFTPYERRFIDECAAQLRGAGFDFFVPHEHELALDGTVTAERIFAKDRAASRRRTRCWRCSTDRVPACST